MTSSPSTSPAQPAARSSEPVSASDIDVSCRGPILFLFASALCWLVLGSFLALISSVQMHGPMLTNTPWLTHGRISPAQLNIFLYGFAAQAAFGIALWLLARLGRTYLAAPFFVTVGGIFWNLGVTLGVVGILAGDASGFAWFDFPRYAAPILLFSYIPIGASALLTLMQRRESALYVSEWFILTAILVFPWIYATANLLLLVHPVRGVTQAAIAHWYANNLLSLCLTPIALASIFYLVPKIVDRPLYNRGLAITGFWLLVLFSGWAGIPPGARLPAWMSSVSTVASLLLLIPVFAAIANWRKTIGDRCSEAKKILPFNFTRWAAVAYGFSAILAAFASLHFVSRATEYTHFTTAISQLSLYGFCALAIFGAIYHIVPQLTKTDWVPGRTRVHYLCSTIGIFLVVFGLAVGGLVQGGAQNNPELDFVSAVKKSTPFVGISTLGFILLLVGHIAFLDNLHRILRRCCACCGSNRENKSKGGAS